MPIGKRIVLREDGDRRPSLPSELGAKGRVESGDSDFGSKPEAACGVSQLFDREAFRELELRSRMDRPADRDRLLTKALDGVADDFMGFHHHFRLSQCS